MPDTFTPNIDLIQPALGSHVNAWASPINNNFTIIDDAVAGVTTVALTNANVVLTNVQSAFRIIAFTGTLTGSVTVTLTAVTGQWVFANATTGSFTVTVKGSVGDTGIVVPQGAGEDLTCVASLMGFTNAATVAGRQGNVVLAVADVSGAAPLASPALTGSPTAPTQAPGDNTTKIATDAFVAAAIAAQVVRTPQTTVLTTGSGNYTTPAGTAYLDITDMLGAGSGGGGSGSGSPGVGAAGGATTFDAFTANGGPATPANTSLTYPTAAAATGGDTNVHGGLGAAPGEVTGTTANNPGSGASSPLGQGGQPTSVSGSGTINASSATGFGAGGGAGGFGSGGSYNTGWGGNAGAYLKKIITSPGGTLAYSIGAGGAGGAAGTSGAVGGAGAGGFIRIVAHFQ